MESVLEVLRAARSRINGEDGPIDWGFGDWGTCTCGHIFSIATAGDHLDASAMIFNTDKEVTRDFRDVIVATARALGWDGENHARADQPGYLAAADHIAASWYVSNMTYMNAKTGDIIYGYRPPSVQEADADEGETQVTQDNAIAVIDAAIEYIEAEEEAARLDVLAAAGRVVDAVEIPTVEASPRDIREAWDEHFAVA